MNDVDLKIIRLETVIITLENQWRKVYHVLSLIETSTNVHSLIGKYFKDILLTLIVITSALSKIIMMHDQIPVSKNVLMNLICIVFKIYSCVHFITAQYGLHGVDIWERQIEIFAQFLVDNVDSITLINILEPLYPLSRDSGNI